MKPWRMGDVMGRPVYPTWREGETLPPYPPPPLRERARSRGYSELNQRLLYGAYSTVQGYLRVSICQ